MPNWRLTCILAAGTRSQWQKRRSATRARASYLQWQQARIRLVFGGGEGGQARQPDVQAAPPASPPPPPALPRLAPCPAIHPSLLPNTSAPTQPNHMLRACTHAWGGMHCTHAHMHEHPPKTRTQTRTHAQSHTHARTHKHTHEKGAEPPFPAPPHPPAGPHQRTSGFRRTNAPSSPSPPPVLPSGAPNAASSSSSTAAFLPPRPLPAPPLPAAALEPLPAPFLPPRPLPAGGPPGGFAVPVPVAAAGGVARHAPISSYSARTDWCVGLWLCAAASRVEGDAGPSSPSGAALADGAAPASAAAATHPSLAARVVDASGPAPPPADGRGAEVPVAMCGPALATAVQPTSCCSSAAVPAAPPLPDPGCCGCVLLASPAAPGGSGGGSSAAVAGFAAAACCCCRCPPACSCACATATPEVPRAAPGACCCCCSPSAAAVGAATAAPACPSSTCCSNTSFAAAAAACSRCSRQRAPRASATYTAMAGSRSVQYLSRCKVRVRARVARAPCLQSHAHAWMRGRAGQAGCPNTNALCGSPPGANRGAERAHASAWRGSPCPAAHGVLCTF